MTASSTAVNRDTGADEADSSRSEMSESSSARERFLEELEEMSHQSSQDLPLEWELTNTVIDTGDFEVEPEHHSVWEEFDGRCVRQDCQEVRHKFHKLYQWVVKCKGDGFDVVSDDEFKLLMGSSHKDLCKLPLFSQDENVESLFCSDSEMNYKEPSYADLIARLVFLEAEKHKLEEKLAVQVALNRKIIWQVEQQFGEMSIQMCSELLNLKTLEDEISELGDEHSRPFLPQRVDSLMKDPGTCLKDDPSHQIFTRCGNVDVSFTLVTKESKDPSQNQDVQTQQSLNEAVHNLHLMLAEKEEQITVLKQENGCLKSDVQKFVNDAKVSFDDKQRIEILQQQLESSENLLQVKNNMIKDLQTKHSCHICQHQTVNLPADRSESATELNHGMEWKETDIKHFSSLDHSFSQNCLGSSAIVVTKEIIGNKPLNHNLSKGDSEHSEREISESEASGHCYSHLTHSSSSDDKPPIGQYSATSSGSSSILLSTFPVGDEDVESNCETPDLQDKELAEELGRLQKDMKETRAIYSKENVLLQEALRKETVLKNLMIYKTVSDSSKADTVNTTSDCSEPSRCKAHKDIEVLKQRLAICLEQNQMLENENAALRTKVREQSATIVVFQNRLHQLDQETQLQKSFSSQLTALQKQRSDLLQLISDMDSGKASSLSDSLKGVLKEENLRLVQEDIMARMEELDHLYKMLTQKQIELQHCETERRHLEQLCLIKDVTEMQLMKQKRLMEEQLSEIEVHLQERETTLMEEKILLLEELKEKNLLNLSHVTDFTQNLDHASALQKKHQSASFRDLSQTTFESGQHTRTSAVPKNPASILDVDRQHVEAVEKLRTKLKEYESQAARNSVSQNNSNPTT